MARVAKTKTSYTFSLRLLSGIFKDLKRSHYSELHFQGKNLLLNSWAWTNVFDNLLRWPPGAIQARRMIDDWRRHGISSSIPHVNLDEATLHFELKFPSSMDILVCVWNAAPNQMLWSNKCVRCLETKQNLFLMFWETDPCLDVNSLVSEKLDK